MRKYLCIILLFFCFSQLLFAKSLDTIPAVLQGNWLRTNGSNEWVYGFSGDKVFYDCAVWQVKSVKQVKKHFYEITFSKNNAEQILFIKSTKANNLWIGKNKKQLAAFSKKKTLKHLPEEDLSNYVFKDDTTVYKGFIENYDTSWGKTGRAIIINPFFYGPKSIQSFLIKINTDGSFKAEVPIAYPQQVAVQFPDKVGLDFAKRIYLFPGKMLFEKISKNGSSIFMGNHSVLNNEMNEFKLIENEHDSLLNIEGHNLNPKQNKDRIISALKKMSENIANLAAQGNISKNAANLEKLKLCINDCHRLIISTNYYIDSIANKRVEGKELSTLFRQQALKMNLASLLNDKVLGNKLSLLNNINYYMLLNSIGFGSDDILQMNKDWHLQTHLLSDLFYAEKYTPDNKVDSSTIYKDIDSVKKYVIDENMRQFALGQLSKDLQAASPKQNATSIAHYDAPFEKIIQKYTGKTIFVDFWGIGCAPCMEGIVATQKQRNAMKKEPVVFLFLADEKTSPLKDYNKWIERMGGENYRLNSDDWNSITTEFKIQGIPRYMIVNKKGKVVNDNLNFHTEDYSDFTTVLKKYINAD